MMMMLAAIAIDAADDIDVRFIQFFVLLQVELSLMITVHARMHAYYEILCLFLV
jgi:hypothetical protein